MEFLVAEQMQWTVFLLRSSHDEENEESLNKEC